MWREGHRSMASAMVWVSRITSISLEMAAPAGLGYYLDSRWSTRPWLLVSGALLGFLLGMWHLLQLASAMNRSASGGGDSGRGNSQRRSSASGQSGSLRPNGSHQDGQ